MEHIIIAVNMESADIFSGFSDSYPEFSLPIEHKAFIGPDEIMEFIITLGPPALSALAAYLVARLQNAKKEIKIKKGEMEIRKMMSLGNKVRALSRTWPHFPTDSMAKGTFH